MRVFIADDSERVLESLKAVLSDIPEVELIGDAGDGVKAVRDIRRLKPDLVILDIRMPGQNGIKVLKAIKEEDHAPKVIMLTSYPYPQYRKRCMELGADYFFKKSTEFEKITEVIGQLIRQSNKR